jgi:hypothetical protein
MLKDGICKVREGYYTKTLAYEDINYAVASSDDQSTIFDGYVRSSTTLTARCRFSFPLSITAPDPKTGIA